MTISLRELARTDTDACLQLFHETVHRINVRDYSSEQIDAWAPSLINGDQWADRFDDRFAYVAVEGSQIVGFTDMTRQGHLDRLFVSADHQRLGIARRLVERLFQDATDNEIYRMTTESSITAKPFFLSVGFEVAREQTVQCRGVQMTNYLMQRAFKR
ncbi:putative N-acetyltransferase YafP [Stieleria maiorica]|uniref:Putative N-acetyltransferase YafP n=1 Tax=Stieleria maiorica TaxID=2795974 RepID=A0A5B9MGK9_9BACT|nr:GNAT family N-acetyltransferase [Stieleria maiorica]QEF99160.1 putative N-acetyltransferase YafP [Stieleria maiorica]